jgi:heme o synthase
VIINLKNTKRYCLLLNIKKVSNIKTAKIQVGFSLIEKVKDIGVLMKFKLSLTVVFSAIMAFMIAIDSKIFITDLIILFLGGLLTSGGASALNQVLERDFDLMMKRTENRPIAAGRMTVSEGVLTAGFMSLIGVSLLALFNPLTAFLGMVSLISYAFIYTPIKRLSNIAVMVGAFPGAMPMVIGCTAAEGGHLTILALTLFALQFIWQFPHFWAIAWLGDEDYKNAGFKLLPNKDGRKDQSIGFQSMLMSLTLIPISWIPFYIGVTGLASAIIITILALILAMFSYRLYKYCDRKMALHQMLYSILYLPLALIVLYFDKII